VLLFKKIPAEFCAIRQKKKDYNLGGLSPGGGI